MNPIPSAAPVLPPAYRLARCGAVASSNDEASRLAAAGAADGTLVWAEAQTVGRGRHGRGWDSPPGNLYLSLVLRPACTPAEALQFGFAAGLGVADAVAGLAPASSDVRLKWPNDVLLNGRKLSGILLESSVRAGRGKPDWVVLGIGVNVAHCPEVPAGRLPATSLAAEGSPGIEVGQVLEAVARGFHPWRQRWEEAGFAPLRAAWLARAAGLGREIEVRQADLALTGRFLDLDADGALILGLPGGGRQRVDMGDVFPAER